MISKWIAIIISLWALPIAKKYFSTLQPFVEEDHFIHSYFLPRPYAIIAPVVAGVILLVIVGLFVGAVLLQDNAKRKAKQKLT